MEASNQNENQQQFAEGEENTKRRKKMKGKEEIMRAVDEAKRMCINDEFERANRHVYDKMNDMINSKIFYQNSIELLPAYFILAEANIGLGGARLKKAEEFLIAAYWNLLKITQDEGGKGGGNEDSLVDDKELDRFQANLHKTFGRLFMAQNRPNAAKQALNELTQGIYQECTEHGPESIYLCSSYYYMGELFQKEGASSIGKAKAFFHKIIQIWKKFIIEKDLDPMVDYQIQNIEPLYYDEAEKHLHQILYFFEMEFGPHDVLTAECQFTYALVALKRGKTNEAMEDMHKTLEIYRENLGEYDRKTKEVEMVIQRIEERLNMAQE